MIAEANVRSMGGLKCSFMGFSFSSAGTLRLSLIENCLLLPQGDVKTRWSWVAAPVLLAGSPDFFSASGIPRR